MSEKVLDTVNEHDAEALPPRRKTGKSVSDSLIVKDNIWERSDLSLKDQLTCLEIIKDGIRARKYAQPAVQAVFGDESQGKFLDDFLWNHIGDPVVSTLTKPKKPGYGDGVSEYNFNYDYPVINGFTDEGNLLNVRETRDKDASSIDRYAVMIGNMATLQVARYRINDIESLVDGRTGSLRQKLIITTDIFDTLEGKTPYDDTKTTSGLMRLNESIVARDERHAQQASLTLGAGITYKPFGEKEQHVGGIDKVVRDRHLLSRLAIAAGVVRDNANGIYLPHSYLHPKVA